MTKSNKHFAEVIEVYNGGAQAAVRFTSGRIECVQARGMTPRFEVGQKGMVDFVRCLNGFEWTFTPRDQKKQNLTKAIEDLKSICSNDMQRTMLKLLEQAKKDLE